jgi:xanthine dehydrogenase accessory factor
MRDLLDYLDNWLGKGEKVALATVVQTWGSSPRGVGAKMAMTASGKIAGSVSGGCVEGAVFEAGVEALRSGRPKWLHFGVADETAWQVGLACGGQVDVFVQPLDVAVYPMLHNKVVSGHRFATLTIIGGPDELLGKVMLVEDERRTPGSVPPGLEDVLWETGRRALADGSGSQIAHLTPDGQPELDVFIEVAERQPVLVIVGGVHTAMTLTVLAHTMGFQTIVIDPRSAFGNNLRFPGVDRLIQAWPDEALRLIDLHERTAVAVLTHDPKIDDPALIEVLNSPAFYVGALGSDTTQAKRRARLREAGINEMQLARLHGPIGLKLGGQTPEEIALAIMAEIVAVQHHGKEEKARRKETVGEA